jgi:hypothetical protein
MCKSFENIKPEGGVTAIIPIASNFSDFDSMKKWLGLALKKGFVLILVRDSFSSSDRERFDEVLKQEISDNQIQVLDVDFHSPGLSRNSGMKIAITQWVTFWDCDDNPDPAVIFEEVKNVPSDVDYLVGQFSVNGKEILTRNIYDLALNPGNWRIVYRRSRLLDLSFVKEPWGEDQLFVIESGIFDSSVIISPKRFYDYRVGTSTQLTSNKNNVHSLCEILKKALVVTLKEPSHDRTKIPQVMMMIRMCVTLLHQSSWQGKMTSIFFATNLNVSLFYNFHYHYVIALFKVLSRKIQFR